MSDSHIDIADMASTSDAEEAVCLGHRISEMSTVIMAQLLGDELCANKIDLKLTLDFLIENVNFIIKYPKSGQTICPVKLLHNVITRVRDSHHLPKYMIGNKDRLLITFNNLMDSRQENSAKVEGGRIINVLLEMESLHLYGLKDWIELLFKSFTVFDKENAFLELSRLIRILLERGLTNYGPSIEWMDTKCVAYLEMLNEYTNPQEILEVLNCLLAYYETRDQTIGLEKVVTNNLKRLLSQLCTFLNNRLLRNTARQLLTYLVYELYCSPTLQANKNEIFEEIHDLPDNYENWPASRATMFFVFAYLQLLHSRCLWEHDIILEAANSYMSVHPLVPSITLKALAWLYPMLSNENTTHDYNTKKRLLISLKLCRSLGSLLTYDTVQMGWLLQEADATLITRLLAVWLIAKCDAEVLEVLNATKRGHFLLQIFLTGPDSEIGSRALKLIERLELYPDLIGAMRTAAPLFCERPDFYSLFLQMKPTVPCNTSEILSSIQTVSTVIPYLTKGIAIQSACSYSMSLLRALKYEPNAVLRFCNSYATIESLAECCVSQNDVTAIAAITFLKQLTKIQIGNTISSDIQIHIDYINILQGNSERLHEGIELLKIILMYSRSNKLSLSCDTNLFSELCDLLCNLLAKKQEEFQILNILKILILKKPYLSCSLRIPNTLRIICVSSLEQKCRKPFLSFLQVWLRRILKDDTLCVDVPTDLLKSFLQQFPDNKSLCDQVRTLLNKYERCR